MILFKYSVVAFVIVAYIFTCIECKGGRGGFRSGGSRSRSSSRSSGGWFSSWGSSRKSSSSVATSKPSYSSNNYGQKKSSSVVTNKPHTDHYSNNYGSNSHNSNNYASNKGTTPRNHVQNSYDSSTRRSTYHSGYRSRTYNNRNRKNNTGVDLPPPQVYYGHNYDGSYSKSSGVRNAVLAGVGGSALGMYLGYQLGSMNNNYNTNNGFGYSNSYPQYTVVHHYHHGEQPIVKNAKIEDNIISQCKSITFCAPNTQPLCLTNGTIYCLAPMNTVINCNINSTNLRCINTTLAAPCLNNTEGNCDDNTIKNMTAQIPCVTNLYMFGDFSTGKLNIHRSNRDVEVNPNSLVANISTNDDSFQKNLNETELQNINTNISGNSNIDTNSTIDVNVNAVSGLAINATFAGTTEAVPKYSSSVLKNEGIMNEFCVTVIAQPISEPKNMNNGEFLDYLQLNKQANDEMHEKFEAILANLLH